MTQSQAINELDIIKERLPKRFENHIAHLHLQWTNRQYLAFYELRLCGQKTDIVIRSLETRVRH